MSPWLPEEGLYDDHAITLPLVRVAMSWRGSTRSELMAHRFEIPLHFLHELIDAEARRPLARRIVLEGRKKAPDDGLRDEEGARTIADEPVVIGIRGNVGTLI